MQSEQINELAAALSKAQGEISPAKKDANNPYFKSKYADLSSVWSACREILAKHGLAVVQTMDEIDGKLRLVTTLMHSSGQWIKSSLPIISAKMDAQGIGSAITYMRRYSLAAIVGVVADDDDDGESSMDRGQKKGGWRKEGHPPLPPEPQYHEPAQNQCLSTDQVSEIDHMMSLCSQDFLDNVWKFMNGSGIKNIPQIHQSMYVGLKKSLSQHIAGRTPNGQ